MTKGSEVSGRLYITVPEQEPLSHFHVSQSMTASPSESRVPRVLLPHTCWNPSIGKQQSWSQNWADEDVQMRDKAPRTGTSPGHGPPNHFCLQDWRDQIGKGSETKARADCSYCFCSSQGQAEALAFTFPHGQIPSAQEPMLYVGGRNFNNCPRFSYCLREALSAATLVLRHGAMLGFFL